MNILVPTDFSEKANSALNYSLSLFKGKSCVFYLLSIRETSNYISDELLQSDANESLYDSLILKNRKKLDQLVKELESQYHGEDYTFKTIADYNGFTDAINQVISLEKIDLVVMGSNGAWGAKEMIFGSHSLRVIRKVPAPVLVVPKDYLYHGLERILLSLDYDQVFVPSEIAPLQKIIPRTQAFVEFLQMKSKNFDEVLWKDKSEKFKKSFSDLKFTFQTITGVSFVAAVISVVQIKKPDILVLQAEEENFLERLFHSSSISSMIKKTTIPVLILHPTPEKEENS
ncbi:MAG: universal stress protein [Bacteroidota bacterium]